MTNNVVAPARGTTLATDEIAGVHYPIDKVAFGVEDAVTLVSATDPLPVGDAAALAKLTSILAKLIASPATEATLASLSAKIPAMGQANKAGSLPVALASDQGTLAVSGTFWQATQPVSIAAMPSTPVTGTFWQATQPVSGAVTVAPPAGIGQQSTAASVSVATSKDQDPIFDHANGTKTSVTTTTTIITPPAGCNYLRISSDVDIFVNTANAAAVDDGTSIRIVANQPEVIPVVAATAVKALSSSGTATVRCTPLKTR